MKKNYFPMFVDLSEKKIVVVGGGVIASRRINTLSLFAEKIKVIAPEVLPFVQEAAKCGKVEWVKAVYEKSFLQDADIVVAATNDSMVNHRVKEDCILLEKEQNRRILVNVADNKQLCDFYFPSIVQTEDAVIGINSGGISPSSTKQIRRQIEDCFNKKSIYQ